MDSPVSADRSTSTLPLRSRASAETRPPSSITSTSPGTSRPASIDCSRPSRSTFASGGRYSASASTARSACISCTKASAALITITTTIATATASIPAAHASAAAAHKRSASGCMSCRASPLGQRRPPRRRSTLGPNCTSRRSASRADSPARVLRRSRSSRSTRSSGSTPTTDTGRSEASEPDGSNFTDTDRSSGPPARKTSWT